MSKNTNTNKDKSYLITFFVISVLLLLAVGVSNYLVDPFFQFRVKDNRYMLNPQFVNGGLIKNYDYNTLVIGSSMVQNYDLSILRKEAGVKPLKLSLGGLNLKEILYLYSHVDKQKVNTFVVNIDLPVFNIEQRMSENHFPLYLSNSDLLSKMKYLWGYESSVRYTPLDLALGVYLDRKKKEDIPAYIQNRISIDLLGSFVHQSTYYEVDKVKNDYLSGISVSPLNQIDMDKRMSENLHSLLAAFEMDKSESNYIFVLPPYSVLYWYHIQKLGYYSDFRDFIRSFVNEVDKYDNVKVLSFYDMDEILDLQNYVDLTHFTPSVSDKVVQNIFRDKYKVSSDNVDEMLIRLDSLITDFSVENKDWLPEIKK